MIQFSMTLSRSRTLWDQCISSELIAGTLKLKFDGFVFALEAAPFASTRSETVSFLLS